MDLTPSPPAVEAAERTRELIQGTVLPFERSRGGDGHDLTDADRRLLQDAARAARVFNPHLSADHGGLGLDRCGQALVFEEAGYSLFGPLALNIAAPDEANMHLLEAVASGEQKVRYLQPLAAGDIRSAFAMTEPAPGAGSDPAQLSTTATKVDAGWSISGHKWFITGAVGAGFFIVMARTSGQVGDAGGATMFLVDADNPGLEIVRAIDTLDTSTIGGHAELRFTDCVVSDDAVLGEVDQGFVNAQVRLAPARLTHCMRWLGIARNARDVAIERAASRQAFGSRLADLGMVQQMIADSEIDLAASRALILRAAWELDNGQRAAQATSIAKAFVAEAVWRVVDRSLQICGALGVSADVMLGRYLREIRPFRIYDGPTETHRWAIARRAVRRHESDRKVPS